MILVKNTASQLQTKLTSKIFIKILSYGDIILLNGELGTGKTTFISGVAEGLKIDKDICSPSFTIINIYKLNKLNKKFSLVHADFYRLDGIDEFINTGIEDYIYNKHFITFIEWGNKLQNFIKKNYLLINFKYNSENENSRQIIFESNNRYWDKKIKRFKEFLNKCTF